MYLNVTILADVKSLHQRSQCRNREVFDFGLTQISVLLSKFQFFIFKNHIFGLSFFDCSFVLINFNNLFFRLLFQRFFLANLLHIGYLFCRNSLVQLSMFSQLIHSFEHVVLQTEGCVSFSIKVDFHDKTIVI